MNQAVMLHGALPLVCLMVLCLLCVCPGIVHGAAGEMPARTDAAFVMGEPDEFATAAQWVKVLCGEAPAEREKTAPTSTYPFSFKYDGKPSEELLKGWTRTVSRTEVSPQETQYVVTWADPTTRLECRVECREFHDYPGLEWVMHFRNGGITDSPILEDIYPLNAEWPGTGKINLYRSMGSTASLNDFTYNREALSEQHNFCQMKSGNGRSSTNWLPFWNICSGATGTMVALGWTGQWGTTFYTGKTQIGAVAGMEIVKTKLFPGESMRTPSVLILNYQGEPVRGHNMLRRFLLAHHIPRQQGQPITAPYCASAWGGTPTEAHLKSLTAMKAHQTHNEYYWIDAGWYGHADLKSSADPMDWYQWAGSWTVNPLIHPQGLKPISQAVHAQGMKFLLWYDIERAYNDSDLVKAHPEWFLGAMSPRGNVLLNLGNPAARQFVTEFLCREIQENGIDCYRHDMNVDPLPFWRGADAPDRQGMTEIRYIEGLYALWDALRQQNPGLIIDNCCSGGQRLDLEALSRSIPLWRSDFQCFPDIYCDEAPQTQLAGLSYWVPLHGTSSGPSGDTYQFRSALGAALNFPADANMSPALWKWHRQMETQYLRARPLFYGDYYPLTRNSVNDDVWAIMQFDRPDLGQGMVLAFRRVHSPYSTATVQLGGLDHKASYEVEDVDTGRKKIVSGKTLTTGWTVRLDKPHTSKLLFYQKVVR